jgi:hypothetical protein
MTEVVKITPATATLSVVPSEDGKAWQAQFTWDDGRIDRVLRFERKEDAEAWIKLDANFSEKDGSQLASKAHARGCDGGVRQELAEGVKARATGALP